MKKLKKEDKRKGFTIVEIVAVIALISVISILAIVAVSAIRDKVNEREYQNLAKTIESAAKGYSNETGINKMFVQTLIDKGLVETDDETKIVYDPRDNSAINCQIVKVENEIATLEDKEKPECDTRLLSDDAIKIQYTLVGDYSNTKKDLPKDQWFNNEIILSVETTGIVDVNLESATYKWTSPLSPDKTYLTEELRIDDKYVNDTYQVTITAEGRKYTAYGKVKIDREPPKVFNLIDTKPEDWSPDKTLQFELSDAESGIWGYQISLDGNTEPTTWIKVNPVGKKNVKQTVTKNLASMREGESVYVWVKDMVGNVNKLDINSDGAIQINNIDGNFDSVTLIGTPSYYSKTVTLKGTARDLKSGLVGWGCSSSKTAPSKTSNQWKKVTKTNDLYNITCPNSATTNGEYYLHAIDAVGNIGTAVYKVTNIDNNIDSVQIIDIDAGNGYRENSTLMGRAIDSKSGIIGYAFTTNANKPSSFTSIAQTNSEIIYTYNANKNIRYYFHVIDQAGNWSYDSITPSGIVKKQSRSGTLTSRQRRNLSESINLPGAVQIINATVDNGNINTSLYYGTATISTYNGYLYTDYENGTCTTNPSWYRATKTEECSGYYSCDSGGTLKGTTCTGKDYTLTSNPRAKQTYTCSGGSWHLTSGGYPSTPCDKGYYRTGNKDSFNCNNPTGSCTNGATQTVMYGCQARCYWSGNYSATCKGGTYTKYTCDYGDVRDGSDCYSCSKGNYVFGECQYACKVQYTYYEYNYVVNYYVLNN